MMNGSLALIHGRRMRVAIAFLTLLALVFVGSEPAGAAPDDKSYSVTVNLDRVCTADTTTLTFTFTNTSTTSTQRMRAARVTAPAGYTITGVATPVASGGQSWLSSFAGSTVTLVADNSGTESDQGIFPGETVAVAVTVTTPAAAQPSVFATQADQNANFGGDGNAFVRIGPDPSVSAVVCALTLTATPDPVSAGAFVTIDAVVADSDYPLAGPVLSFSGTLSYSVNSATAGCASPGSGTTGVVAGQGSFALTALSGIGATDACTVDGTVKSLTDSVTFTVDGSAALCTHGQALCQTDTEISADSVTFANVLCLACKLPTTLVADYLEGRCTGPEAAECSALFMANSTTLNVPFFIDVTVTGTPRGQVTIIAELAGVLVDLGSCKQNAPPCIYSITGSGSTNTWRVLLATDPPIGVR